jgi:hypothetical protein
MWHSGIGKLDGCIALMFRGVVGGEIAVLELGVWAGRFSLRGKFWSIVEKR